MTFVSRFAETDEVIAYDLDNLWNFYNRHLKGWKPDGFRYAWTIEKVTGNFLILVRNGKEPPSDADLFVFHYENKNYEISLLKHASGTRNEPIILWEMIETTSLSDAWEKREDIINSLKEALKSYKANGVLLPLENCETNFNF